MLCKRPIFVIAIIVTTSVSLNLAYGQFKMTYVRSIRTEESVVSVCFSSDGRLLAAGTKGWGGKPALTKIFDVSEDPPRLTNEIPGHKDGTTCMKFSPDGKILATGGGYSFGKKDYFIKLWDTATSQLLKQIKVPSHGIGYDKGIDYLLFSPNGKTLVSVSGKNGILWEVPSGQEIKRFSLYKVPYYGMGGRVFFNEDGVLLYIGEEEEGFIIKNLETDYIIKKIDTFIDSDHRMDASLVTNLIVTEHEGEYRRTPNYLNLWNAETGECIKTFYTDQEYFEFNFAHFTPDGMFLLVGWSGDGKYGIVLETKNFEVVQRVPEICDYKYFTFSLSGKFLTAIKGGRIHIWNISLLPPYLQVKAKFDDTETGANGLLDSGEEANIVFTISNTGKGSAFGITLHPSVDNNAVSVPEVVRVGAIPDNKTKEVRIPVSASPDAQTGAVNVTIETKEINGFDAQTVRFSIPVYRVEPPKLVILEQITINDKPAVDIKVGTEKVEKEIEKLIQINGNGNSIIENGETVEISVPVKNSGLGDAYGVKLSITSINPEIKVEKGEAEIGDIKPGETENGRFVITVSRSFITENITIGFRAVDIREQ